MADDAAPSAANSSADQQIDTRNPVGCAIPHNIVENAAEKPSATSSFHDVPTKRLHNAADDHALSCSKTWDNRRTDV